MEIYLKVIEAGLLAIGYEVIADFGGRAVAGRSLSVGGVLAVIVLNSTGSTPEAEPIGDFQYWSQLEKIVG